MLRDQGRLNNIEKSGYNSLIFWFQTNAGASVIRIANLPNPRVLKQRYNEFSRKIKRSDPELKSMDLGMFVANG